MKRAAIAGAVMLAGLSLAGCSDEYGYGRGGYAAYGGYPGYYGGGFYPGYGGYYGWYGGFYYPGTGFYVYDQYRRPYRWNGVQQRYWQGRLNGYHGQRGGPEWRGFAGGQPGYGNRAYGGQGAQGYRGGYAQSAGGPRAGGGHAYHR